jgi:hypothetical protein
VVGFLLAFCMLLANLRISPFADAGLNFVNTIAQLNLCAFLFVALLLKARPWARAGCLAGGRAGRSPAE